MLSAIASASFALSASKDYTSLFSSWKVAHGKTYVSAAKEAASFTQFALNEEIITTHNAKGLSYTLGHNEFSDLSADEFYMTKLGYNMSLARQDTFSTNPVHEYKGEALPDAIDWVTKGAVSPVKNQGQCGSCWAFSTSGSIEGALAIATGNMSVISEEELVQCDPVDSGCQGGLMDNAFKWVEKNGLATEANYPYMSGTGITGLCNKAKIAESAVYVTGFTDVKSGDEDALRSAVAQQPVSIAIEADKSAFQLYKTGVLDNKGCGSQLDHGVLVVGYGTDEVGIFKKKTDYWKVKNSWGATWGEAGYIRMVRGKNQCGIAVQPSYPTGAKTGAPSRK